MVNNNRKKVATSQQKHAKLNNANFFLKIYKLVFQQGLMPPHRVTYDNNTV